ncbi:single-stranded nucleic acid binding protein [Rhodotorula toruloides]|uniref:Probable RNA-binding protein 18 n=1 Tax=Rhodotorula toruloides TaxID=5286 RepID=A0A511KKC1_RHOTO|nr:single-stranded nucleic acid binding protein [Rhodotorula toruloides]
MAATPTQSEKRLYIGNLATSVDEYSLMQACAKYGKIAKLDYLFHKTGPNKGRPRGYAFVEYSTREEAQRAMQALHDKLFRGRKMVVSLASEQQDTTPSGTKKPRGPLPSDLHKPTAISLLKGTGVGKAPTNRKIAALEAKLAAMRQSKEGASPSGSATPPSRGSTPIGSAGEASTSGTAGIDPIKAGLPVRPYFESQEPPREM